MPVIAGAHTSGGSITDQTAGAGRARAGLIAVAQIDARCDDVELGVGVGVDSLRVRI